MAADEYDYDHRRYPQSYLPHGYKQSRSALRERFGTRSIGGPATQSPRESMSGLGIAADPVTGQRSADDWNQFFQPSRGLMGRRPVAAPSAVPLQQPMTANVGTPLPARATLAKQQPDLLKSALDSSTQFWARFGNPQMAGKVLPGTSVTTSYGTASVASASENRLKRLMRRTALPEMYDLSDV